MQISNNRTQIYNYTQDSNKSNSRNESNSFNTELTKDSGDRKIIKENIIDFIDKNGGFSSISKENEELFRSILSDNKVSNEEWKNISYEQAKELNNLIRIGSGGVMALNSNIFDMADISYDENFNKALYETLKNIDDDKKRSSFASDVEAKLGYNSKRLVFEGTIEENIQKDIAREKEKYKDSSNSEMLANIIQDLKNWKTTDYGSFIKNLTNEYKSLSEHPLLSSESKLKYKKYSQYTANMEINYNKAKNEPKYA
ncbi:hypothetical protein N5U14_05235 [Aliarcobacter butzleri]|uniref:hypothetical protein n=1 Tax=Aliarcobacter butzleri TaxID=28197 RepID=UPI0021B19DD2|nr:hypothetical protein [Aliarcobacter butzleri]MCT7610240.1 hypothetical protein [Aliarcobacter butzleri]